MAQPWADRCRTNYDTFDCEEGEKILRIYTKEATRANMLNYLQRVVLGSLIVRTDRTKLVSRVEDTGDSNSVVLKKPALRAVFFIRSFV